MEQSEIEVLVGELETRVDRLRALYEQYFMGIEKIEPGVVKKDVERRFQALRREQIRNTALRFRFQMVVQRYSTYQSYWIRVCRQIEEGTYKRDVLAAQRRMDSDKAAARRTGKIEPKEQRASIASDDEVGLVLDSDFLESEPPPAPNEDNEDFLPLIIPQRRPEPAKAAPKPPSPEPPKPPARKSIPPRPTPGQVVTPESRAEKMRQLAAQLKATRRTGPGTPSQQ